MTRKTISGRDSEDDRGPASMSRPCVGGSMQRVAARPGWKAYSASRPPRPAAPRIWRAGGGQVRALAGGLPRTVQAPGPVTRAGGDRPGRGRAPAAVPPDLSGAVTTGPAGRRRQSAVTTMRAIARHSRARHCAAGRQSLRDAAPDRFGAAREPAPRGAGIPGGCLQRNPPPPARPPRARVDAPRFTTVPRGAGAAAGAPGTAEECAAARGGESSRRRGAGAGPAQTRAGGRL